MLANDVQIEKAKPEDLPAILALQKLAFRSEAELYGDFSLPPLLQTEESIRKEFENGIILKAMKGNEIVGSVRARMDEGDCFIAKLVVHPEMQGKGIGKLLMNAIENSFSDVASFRVSTGHRSLRNLRLYEKMGYQAVGEEPITANLTMVKLKKLVG
ncbi:GNAT family N-acetyltransferase [Mucilaginibacter corticis]|uniref:GNAT family N-acetyltransferase n=1 Tax=Mucilaginibacter corticis TaxID=2597670 RepID=A0A556MMM3_9SPHI|nr:GNAT family N-acetyltransferase [Mucilaginibacter corticis]TSJ41125.1 GNAT family N-acetyltransferase [Mucilaginibacter corticis]